MQLEEILKQQGLSDEQVATIKKSMTDNKIYITSLENADERYTKLKGQKEDAEKQLQTANDTILELKNTNGDVDALKTKIEEYQKEIGRLKDEAIIGEKTNALKEQLAKAGVVDTDYLIYKHGGIEKFNFDKDNKPIGVEETIKPYKEDKTLSHLFNQNTNYNPHGGGEPPMQNPWSKENFNLTEQGKIIRENPAKARELASAAGITI